MNRKFRLNTTSVALGLTLVGGIAVIQAFAGLTDPPPTGPGFVELGFNEDDNEDQDIWNSSADRWDPRANILGQSPDDGDPDGCTNHNPTDPETSPGTLTPTCAIGPDWDDLLYVDDKGTPNDRSDDDVVYKDVIPGSTSGNGTDDYIDYGGLALAFVADGVVPFDGDDTVFAGSNKNDHPISTYQWKSGSVPPKDDVSNGYFYAVEGTTTPYTNHLMISGGFERISNNGDSHIDIEFNQDKIGLSDGNEYTVTNPWEPASGDAPPTCDQGETCTFTGERTTGDILVSMDFEKGGDFGSLIIYKWDGDAGEWTIAATTGGEGCSSDGKVCAFNNNDDIAPGNWPTFDKNGNLLTSGMKLPRNAFTEGIMDVTALLEGTGIDVPCISSVTVKTRSSTSFTATLKDFVLGAFDLCKASVATDIYTDSNVKVTYGKVPKGTTVYDKATVTATRPGGGTLIDPTGTVTFHRYTTEECTETATTQEVTLTNDGNADGVATAVSSTVTPAAGFLSYQATYSGDTNYPETTLAGAECEKLSILDSSMTTQILDSYSNDVTGTTVYVGTVVHDKAIVTGTDASTDPTGDVTFKRYTTQNCSGSYNQQVVPLAADATTDGVATAETSTFTPVAGYLSYHATYSGDSIYPSASYACEPLAVDKYTPAVSSYIKLHDVANVTGSASSGPTGSVTFKRFASNDCTGTYSEMVVPLTVGTAEEWTDLASEHAQTTDGYVSYLVEYGGDDNYKEQTSGCEKVTVDLP